MSDSLPDSPPTSLPNPFPILHAQMQPYLDYNSQPMWAGDGLPIFDPFLPMPHLPGQIVTPSAANRFAFHQAGATLNRFGFSRPAQFPAEPFNTFGSNLYNSSMDHVQPAAGLGPVVKTEDQASSIPLICLLCPKHPKFSDVSHLLTHISSKSHLAAQFRLQHSGKAEDKHALDQYKLWSDNNGVDKLVANRIAAKELKKPAKRQRFAGVKKETETNVKLETNDSGGAQLEYTPLHPNPNTWHLHAPRDSSFATFYGPPSYSTPSYSTPSYSTPSYSDHSAYPLPDSPQSSAYIKKETSQSGTDTGNASFLSATFGVDDGNDASKLKGTVYPGMGLFDAATPIQKRKRNQKKHASVIRNMEMTSASIGQDEEVWDMTMSEVTRTRNVYDSPSIDGSPDSRDELPSTTKKRRSRRPAVANAGSRRQTRAVTRAANTAKVGNRRSARQAKHNIKLEGGGLDSEDDSGHRLDDDDEEEEAVDGATGSDVFLDHRQVRQDAPEAGPEGAPGHRFDLSFRHAMSTLPSNTPLMTSASVFPRSNQSFFPGLGMKENDSMAFPMHHQGAVHGYFPQNRQSMQAGASGFNPLYLQRQDNYPFLYGGHSFEVAKPATPVFQPMNGPDLGGLGSAPAFQPGHAQHNEFDM
ncbi:hypothetical protein DHEL01_v200525 [Diaporthe helianthi]|uniref:Uncharacterized protein n=1 Tax=Diaporthe helianthi TaxID=158607 RepID=A0A2P5IEY7_DIAHE|nr:hypothetical protein DHEL01_v200525 [Diaporthe helianthi]